jgi:hypothetical protein
LGRLAPSAIADGGSPSSICDHMLLKIDFPTRPAITDAIKANGLYRSFTALEPIRLVG